MHLRNYGEILQLIIMVNQKNIKTRPKYGRPCDNCSLRRVKCGNVIPCPNCIRHNLPCTNDRGRRKKGPKNVRPKTMENIYRRYNHSDNLEEVTLSKFQPQVILAELIPFFQVYQTWFYEIWPIVSIAQLTSSVSSREDVCKLDVNHENIQFYALCCALAGALKQHIDCFSPMEKMIKIPDNVASVDFISECLRARNFCDYRSNPTIESVLVSFFLHVYYSSAKLNTSAILYLKEAIAIAELLGLHDDKNYKDKPREERHRLRNIYYILVVAERFTSLEADFSVLLDASVPYEQSSVGDLSQIVKVFALPDKSFFMKRFNCNISVRLIPGIQDELYKIRIGENSSEIQKVNILLSKSWMQLLVWNLYNERKFSSRLQNDCFSTNYPIKIARDFLETTQTVPFYAFETNGPCVTTKLLTVAESLSDAINENNFNVGYNALTSVLEIISRLNLNSNFIPSILQQKLHQITEWLWTRSLSDKFSTGMPDTMKVQMLDENEYIQEEREVSSKADSSEFRWSPMLQSYNVFYGATGDFGV